MAVFVTGDLHGGLDIQKLRDMDVDEKHVVLYDNIVTLGAGSDSRQGATSTSTSLPAPRERHALTAARQSRTGRRARSGGNRGHQARDVVSLGGLSAFKVDGSLGAMQLERMLDELALADASATIDQVILLLTTAQHLADAGKLNLSSNKCH